MSANIDDLRIRNLRELSTEGLINEMPAGDAVAQHVTDLRSIQSVLDHTDVDWW